MLYRQAYLFMKKKKKSIRHSKTKGGLKPKGWVISEDGTSYFKLPSNLHNESSLRPIQNSIIGGFVGRLSE